MILKKLGSIFAGVKTRWLTLISWVIIVSVVSVIWPQVNNEETNSSVLLPDSAMSVEASKLSKEYFPNETGMPLLLVWYRESGLVEDDFATIQSFYKQILEDPIAYQSTAPDFANIPLPIFMSLASENGNAMTTPIFFEANSTVDQLHEARDQLEEIVSTISGGNLLTNDLTEEGLHLRLTGPVAIQTDATALFAQADFQLLIGTVLLVLILLVILYRSLILALIPLVTVVFAYGLISPLLGFMAKNGWIIVDAQSVSIMTVLLFGAGTDYCLFLISRYRDELQLEESKYTALNKAIYKSGGAIMISAFTTALGLYTLGLAQYASYDRFAVPFSVAIIVMGISVLTILPAILVVLGRVAFHPFIPRTEEMVKDIEQRTGKKIRIFQNRTRLSKATGRAVTNKPWHVIIITLLFLGVLAAFYSKIEYTYGIFESFPSDLPSREGHALIANNYPVGEVAPIQLIVDTEGNDVLLTEPLMALPYIDKVKEPQIGVNNENILQYSLIFSINPYSQEAIENIKEIKSEVEKALSAAGIQNSDEKVWLGGETATLYDTQEITHQDQNKVIVAILTIMAVLLALYLRSIIAMIYLLATVVLSFFSALGIGWIIIHYILGEPAIQGLIPLYAFVFLVALGGDYNIFMMSSIWKNRNEMPLKRAISEGVEETSRVITSAGLILAGTFLVLAVMPLQVLVQFGIVTAIGIFIDTFVIRPFLVPSITTVLGKYSFWPGKLWRKKDQDIQESK